jgi:hypothetical protein
MQAKSISMHVHQLYKAGQLRSQSGAVLEFLKENREEIDPKNLLYCLNVIQK